MLKEEMTQETLLRYEKEAKYQEDMASLWSLKEQGWVHTGKTRLCDTYKPREDLKFHLIYIQGYTGHRQTLSKEALSQQQ